MNNNSLQMLYLEHEGKVSDKWSIYLREYDRLFSQYKKKRISLLEIGIQNGGSLDIWAQYFCEAEIIVGCDINQACGNLVFDDERIVVLVGDANSDKIEKLITKQTSQYDLIIDDGSHKSSDIIKSFSRYFPYLKDGGVFIVEDLHCSYWNEFEGGLFDPFSSVSFFKRLADILNHEHWGLEKERTAILSGFLSKYDIKLDESLLEHIHSIEFINSMCVIRKERIELNILGTRIIAGELEGILSGHLKLNNQKLTPCQLDNQYSVCRTPPDEGYFSLIKLIKERDHQLSEQEALIAKRDHQLSEQEALIADRERQLLEIYESTSWTITWPLRSISLQVKKVLKRLAELK